MDNSIGLLGTRYRMLEHSPRNGSASEVYLCSFVDAPEKHLALKTFQRQFIFNRSVRRSFIKEICIWRRLSHLPNVLPTFGVDVIDDRPFILMYAVDGNEPRNGTLRNLLRRERLGVSDVLRYAFHVAFGMREASEALPGLVHGDLKPENLLIIDNVLHIADFGLAQVISESGEQTPVVSTYAYRAPECWFTGQVTAASDIYAFGALLLEMLQGKMPFYATTPRHGATHICLGHATSMNLTEPHFNMNLFSFLCHV